jgi:hypothetical protein
MRLVTSLSTSATALMLAASLLSIFGSTMRERTFVVGLGTLCAVAAVCTGSAAIAMLTKDPWYESLWRGNGMLPVAAVFQGKSELVLQAAGPVLLARSSYCMAAAVAITAVALIMLVGDLFRSVQSADSASYNDPLVEKDSYGAGVPDARYTVSSGGSSSSSSNKMSSSSFKDGSPPASQPADDDPASLWPARGSRRQDGSGDRGSVPDRTTFTYSSGLTSAVMHPAFAYASRDEIARLQQESLRGLSPAATAQWDVECLPELLQNIRTDTVIKDEDGTLVSINGHVASTDADGVICVHTRARAQDREDGVYEEHEEAVPDGLQPTVKRIWIPVGQLHLHAHICTVAHAGGACHRGVRATMSELQFFYWLRQDAWVDLFIRRCINCRHLQLHRRLVRRGFAWAVMDDTTSRGSVSAAIVVG